MTSASFAASAKYEGKTWEKSADGKVKCLTCSHKCIITPSRTGICGVRKNIDGKLVLLVYGRAIASHSDPVEKKPLHHFLPGTQIYSIGTIGCNLKCDFCQNWDISQIEHAAPKTTPGVGDIEDSALGKSIPPEAFPDIVNRGRFRSVAFTYNEPSIFTEYAMDVSAQVKPLGVKTVYVTNGFESAETVANITGVIDAMNIDLKAFTEDFYRKHCKAQLAPVMETIKRARAAGIWVEVTTLLIPDENDGDDELKKLTQWLSSVDVNIPWHISSFHPDFKMMNKHRTPISTLQRAYAIGKAAGLNYIYMGNVGAAGKADTECPKCHTVLIRRQGMMCTEVQAQFDQDAGTCRKCGTAIPGVWK